MIDTKILQQAIDKWGNNAQTELIIEECAELILALQKLKRHCNLETIKNVHDEIADVIIMTEQAQLLFDKELIQTRVEYKMNRLKERLNK